MKKLHILPITLFVFVLMASTAYAVFPDDAEWKLPAKYRLIYEINLAGVTEENVYVDVNIPDYVYTHILTRFQNGELCGLIENNRQPDEVWPVVFYASTFDVTQKYIPHYSILGYYEYNTGCLDVNGNIIPVKFPSSVRLHIPDLDGNATDFNTYNHYVFVYEPFLFLDTKDPAYMNTYYPAFGWIGAPMVESTLGDTPAAYVYNTGSSTTPVRRIINNLNIQLNPYDQVYVKFSYNYIWTNGSVAVSVLFVDKYGNKHAITYTSSASAKITATPFPTDQLTSDTFFYFPAPNPGYTTQTGTTGFIDLKMLLSELTGIPYTDIIKIEKVAYMLYAANGTTSKLDDVYIIVS